MDQKYPREQTVRVLQQQDNGLWVEEERTYLQHGPTGEIGIPSPELLRVRTGASYRYATEGEVPQEMMFHLPTLSQVGLVQL